LLDILLLSLLGEIELNNLKQKYQYYDKRKEIQGLQLSVICYRFFDLSLVGAFVLPDVEWFANHQESISCRLQFQNGSEKPYPEAAKFRKWKPRTIRLA
jgi:hypothetical protein